MKFLPMKPVPKFNPTEDRQDYYYLRPVYPIREKKEEKLEMSEIAKIMTGNGLISKAPEPVKKSTPFLDPEDPGWFSSYE